MGWNTGTRLDTGASNLLLIGGAGGYISSGGSNICLGANAGGGSTTGITTGSSNIIIGGSINPPTQTGNNWLGIGYSGIVAISGQMDGTGPMAFTMPIKLPNKTVAGLLAAATAGAGAQSYASNGRKSGEGAGAGTGIPVWCDGTNWRTYYDNTIAAA
jgi:hypothetical protein